MRTGADWKRRRAGRWILGAGCCSALLGGTLPAPADIASANFDDGTVAPFVIEPAGTGSVVRDPTGGAHGGIVELRYKSDTTPVVLRSALVYRPTAKMGLGSTFYFSGDVYVPDTTFNLANMNVGRLLISYRAAAGPLRNDTTDVYATISLAACGIAVQWSDDGKSGWTNCVAFPEAGVWHHLETQVTLNHSMSATDGVIRLWVDGRMAYQNVKARFTNPKGNAAPFWREWAIGVDRNSADNGSLPDISDGGTISEVRYWDNVSFSTARKTGPGPGWR